MSPLALPTVSRSPTPTPILSPRHRLGPTTPEPPGTPSPPSSSFEAIRQRAHIGSVVLAPCAPRSFFLSTLVTYVSPRIASPHQTPTTHTPSHHRRTRNFTPATSFPTSTTYERPRDRLVWDGSIYRRAEGEVFEYLNGGVIEGPGKLALPLLFGVRRDKKASVIITHLGSAWCVHEGIVHGGCWRRWWMSRWRGRCVFDLSVVWCVY